MKVSDLIILIFTGYCLITAILLPVVLLKGAILLPPGWTCTHYEEIGEVPDTKYICEKYER